MRDWVHRRSLVIVLCCLCPAMETAGANAQAQWQDYVSPGIAAGSAICPTNDPQSGQFFCFALRCAEDGPVEWEIFYGGGAPPVGEVTASLTIDGQPQPPMRFVPQDVAGYVSLIAGWEADRDALLSDRLSAGSAAFLSLQSAQWQAGYVLPLSGARLGLAQTREACPLPPPPPIPDPLALARAEVASFCAGFGGVRPETEGTVTRPDLNEDGRADLVIDWGGLNCVRGGTLYCGSAGCRIGLFLALPGGGYRELIDTNLRGFRVDTMTVLKLNLHGNACDRSGHERCEKYFSIDALGGLQPLE